MRKLVSLAMVLFMAAPALSFAASQEDAMIQELQKQIQELSTELEDLSDRLDDNERHTALDRIELTGDLRVKADSLSYNDVTTVQQPFRNGIDTVTGASGYTMGYNLNPDGTFKRSKNTINNDILYTTRLRINMKARVWDNVSFAGRLTMFKNWGDSAGTKVFDSWDSFTQDGTNSGNTTDDTLHVERAYFNWKDIAETPFYLSVGRRPSTYGVPSNYRENELRGGTPSGHVVNFNFDGITIGYRLADITGIEGQTVRFCYGQGFESEYGNGELWGTVNTDDTHLGGFNIDFLDDGTNFIQLTAFRAEDIVDGFKGTFALPPGFGGSVIPGAQPILRYNGQTNVGDLNLLGLGYAREEENGVKWFGSFGFTQSDPNGKAGMFGGMLSDAALTPVSSDGNPLDGTNDIVAIIPNGLAAEKKDRDGHSIYVGLQTPAPLGKFGIEYNYGSKYWTPFTQAQDDVIGSKLATRGHVGEAYYIFDINPNMFIKVGAIYYDYNYTGSGSPVGKPKDVDDVQDGKAYSILPVVDEVLDLNASLTMKF